eukprot:303104_1
MGNSNTKSIEPTAKVKVPTKYKCPVANRIMVNPQRIICTGNVYDELSITKWIESNRWYDPVSATPFTAPNGKLLKEECTELKNEIEQFLTDNDYYKEMVISENVGWNNAFARFDERIKEKALYYEELCQALRVKGHRLFFPNTNNKNDIAWNKDLLLLLSSSKIPIITLVGASRQGKSTLINDILGLHDNPAFEMSNSPDIAQTKGAWIALYKSPKLNKIEEKEEKKEHIEVGNIVYNQSFFIIDMEGLTNQFTKFTEKVFYSIYAFS